MGNAFQNCNVELSAIQTKAVKWKDDSLLVLAGPGSGKTRVLTCRAAQLLDESRDERFRILALTFTNKAANEMSKRITAMVPELKERVDIHTFHSFCAQVLRQHGAHIGIESNFAIFSQKSDQRIVLEDAVRRNGLYEDPDVRRFLPMINCLKARLIGPEQVKSTESVYRVESFDFCNRLTTAYSLYEGELRRNNALDFNSLVFEAYKLFSYPALVQHYQTVYRYWMIDEFQDTNTAQYMLLRRMAGDSFRNLFAVADDDQTIYEWNGASVKRIRTLIDDFGCEVIQLPTNYRCPPQIVEVADCLLVYNARRNETKRPAQPEKRKCVANSQQIRLREFPTDEAEVSGIAMEIAELDAQQRANTLVLARTRGLLNSIHKTLAENDIQATILMRRDDFASPEFRWLAAYLKQLNRPQDLRNFTKFVEEFSRFTSAKFDIESLLVNAKTKNVTYLSIWLESLQQCSLSHCVNQILCQILEIASGNAKLKTAIDQIIRHFQEFNTNESLKDDLSAWKNLCDNISTNLGFATLDRFLQDLELSSKNPVQSPGSVSLATIHGAKGLEFDYVYLIGLAEEVLPSWHSTNKGNGSASLEEERRGCFVAITRTKRQLILSWAREYNGWQKKPSRFLTEMGFDVSNHCDFSGEKSLSEQQVTTAVDY